MRRAPQEIRSFFITSITWNRRQLFATERQAELFIDVLFSQRDKNRFQLHEFVLMLDHFHLLLTPAPEVSLERAVQFIKGGFSFRAKKELGFNGEVWQAGFTLRRIENAQDYLHHRNYISANPVRKKLAASPADYRYSSTHPGYRLDPPPPGLKPRLERSISPQA